MSTQPPRHGHVIPRADGLKARCGGPALCNVCQREATQLLPRIDVEERIKNEWLADNHPELLSLLVAWSKQELFSSSRIAAWGDVERYLVEHLK